jgi:hypothetical protein
MNLQVAVDLDIAEDCKVWVAPSLAVAAAVVAVEIVKVLA